jgi:outer membrane protein
MKYLLPLICCLFVFPLSAQQPERISIGLKQAIELGLKNRYDIQSGKYNMAIADNRLSKSKKEWLPDISGSGRMAYNPQIQATYIPAGFFGPSPELVALGANSSAIFGLDLNQNLFKPGIVTDVKIARNHLEQEKEINHQQENNIKEQIVLAYLNVVLKKLQVQVTMADEQRYKEYEEVAEGKVQLKALIENDYLKAKLDYENSKVETQKAKQNYELALGNVRYQLNIPAETQLILTDTLNAPELAVSADLTKPDPNNRTEIKQLTLQQQGIGLELSKTRQNALPSLAFFANYSEQFSYSNLDYALGKWWTPFNYLGIRLNVPLTANFKNSNSIQEYRLKSMQTDLDLKQKTADVTYEIQKASSELKNAVQNMKVTGDNYNLSKVIYENQKQQYAIGSFLYSNLLDTDKSLLTTEQSYIKSVYDYLIATINYQKAIGTY